MNKDGVGFKLEVVRLKDDIVWITVTSIDGREEHGRLEMSNLQADHFLARMSCGPVEVVESDNVWTTPPARLA